MSQKSVPISLLYSRLFRITNDRLIYGASLFCDSRTCPVIGRVIYHGSVLVPKENNKGLSWQQRCVMWKLCKFVYGNIFGEWTVFVFSNRACYFSGLLGEKTPLFWFGIIKTFWGALFRLWRDQVFLLTASLLLEQLQVKFQSSINGNDSDRDFHNFNKKKNRTMIYNPMD